MWWLEGFSGESARTRCNSDGRAEDDDESVTSPLSAQLLERGGDARRGTDKQKARRGRHGQDCQDFVGGHRPRWTPFAGSPTTRMFCAPRHEKSKSPRRLHD